MRSKQLANVLIKVLGLSICIHAIPSAVSGIIVAATAHNTTGGAEAIQMSAYAIGAVVEAAVGIAIIALSRTISGWMFKSEEE